MNAIKPLIVLITCSFLVFPGSSNAQDAEKQKVIDVINTELDAFYKKDREKWANTWVHSAKISMTDMGAYGVYQVNGWDSLSAEREEYFKTPVNPDMPKITKGDFDVTIKGSLAIVDLVQKAEDFSSRQTVLLEKQGKAWKIFRMITLNPDSYKATDSNIEAAINLQGYHFLQLKKVDDAIRVFTLNTQLFPAAWNTWDSLAEAYMIKGEKDIAIGFYKKSMALNPKNTNGQKMLEKLGVTQ